MVKHTKYLVKKAPQPVSPRAASAALSAKQRAASVSAAVSTAASSRGPPFTNSNSGLSRKQKSNAPSYRLGSTAERVPSGTHVTRHHVSLRKHNPHKVQMYHNGPIVPHSAIASPRKNRSANKAHKSRGHSNYEEPISAAERARRRHSVMHHAREEKAARLAEFDAKVKKRVKQHVREQREHARALRSQWSQLEAEARRSAADWVESDFPKQAEEASDQEGDQGEINRKKKFGDLGSNGSGKATSAEKIKKKKCLQEHVLDVSARTRATRAALFSRSRQAKMQKADAGSPSGLSVSSSPPLSEAPSVVMSEAPSVTPSEKWTPSMGMLSGALDESAIDEQSSAHLVAVTRRAEMRAHREHVRRLRKEKQRAAAEAKRLADMEKMRKMQDMLIEESRIANTQAREEYEEFLRQAERGAQEIEASKVARVERESHIASRYMVALREKLLQRLSKKKLSVPNICSCVRPEGEFEIVPHLLQCCL